MLVTGVGDGQQHSKDVINVQKLSPISIHHHHDVINITLVDFTYAKRILIRIHDVSRKVRCRLVSKVFQVRVQGFGLRQCPSPRFDSVRTWYFRFSLVQYVQCSNRSRFYSSVSTKLWSTADFWKLGKEVLSNKMYFRGLFIPVKIRFYILLICQKQVRSHPNRSFCVARHSFEEIRTL